MLGQRFLWAACICANILGATQTKKSEKAPYLPEAARQMTISGRNGDALAMIDANRTCEVWGAKPSFDPGEFQRSLTPLAQAGDPKAMRALGTSLIRYATPGPGDEAKRGKAWVRLAAESGYAPAMLDMVSHGLSREERNAWVKRAYETLLPQAEAGDVGAMLELQQVPDLIGDSRNPSARLISNEEKEHWIRKAMAQGSTEALIALSRRLRERLHFDREKRIKDHRESMVLAKRLFEMGHWPTMVDIGALYAEGRWPHSKIDPTETDPLGGRLRADPVKAWEWWDKAIAIGGKEAVLKYLLEWHSLGDPDMDEQTCRPLPKRPR